MDSIHTMNDLIFSFEKKNCPWLLFNEHPLNHNLSVIKRHKITLLSDNFSSTSFLEAIHEF